MNVIYTYGGILLGHRKEGSTDRGYNADVPQNRVLGKEGSHSRSYVV